MRAASGPCGSDSGGDVRRKKDEGYTAPPPTLQPDESNPDLSERKRLNLLDSYYRGTLFGAGRLALLSMLSRLSDEGVSPATKRVRDELRKEYDQIISDLARYDRMPRSQNASEFGAAAIGQLGGGMLSPESWIGLGAKSATRLGRALKGGLQQGVANAATDPIVQGLNIGAGVQDRFDPWRTAIAGGLGFATSTAANALGEGLRSGARNIAEALADRGGWSRPGVQGPVVPSKLGIATETARPTPPRMADASKSPKIYEPPQVPPRPFEEDYPHGASSVSGKLSTDVEGRPLVAKDIVGRTEEGGLDQPLPRRRFEPLAEALTGNEVRPLVPDLAKEQLTGARELGRTYYRDWIRPEPYLIEMREDATAKEYRRGLAHEIAHAIDYRSGVMSTWLNTLRHLKELGDIYNTLNNPERAPDGRYARPGVAPVTPQTFGYSFFRWPREYWAEAIRAYLTNPNYIKTVAPKTAATIRDWVNAHPELSKIIQFNAVGGAAIIPQYLADDARAEDADGGARR